MPNRASVTGLNANGSNQAFARPMPRRISTSDFTWSARCALRRVQRRAAAVMSERRAAGEADDVVHLPAADDRGEHAAAVQPAAARTERQLGEVGDLQVVRAVEPAERRVQVVELGDHDPRRAVAARRAGDPVAFDSV